MSAFYFTHDDRTPMQVLDDETALTMTQLAYVTGGLFTKGRNKGAPDRRRGVELVETGAVKVIDPSQPVHRWKVWTDEARRYLAEGPRRLQPLVVAPNPDITQPPVRLPKRAAS